MALYFYNNLSREQKNLLAAMAGVDREEFPDRIDDTHNKFHFMEKNIVVVCELFKEISYAFDREHDEEEIQY